MKVNDRDWSVTDTVTSPKEYIEKEEALELSKHLDRKNGNKHFVYGVETYAEYLQGLPPADVKPVVKGKWIEGREYLFESVYTCSACGSEFVLEAGTPKDNEYNFCPNCGADMREANDE